MLKGDIISGFVMLFLSIFIYTNSFTFPKGENMISGPAFYPQLLSVLLAIVSMALIGRSIKGLRKGIDSKSKNKIENFNKVLIVVISTVIYISVLKTLGFLITTFIYLTILTYLADPEKSRIKESIIVSAIMSGVVYFIFVELFSASLPRGIIL